jgi:Zn finger protein HypA/HybF involved in hydrogenase expression
MPRTKAKNEWRRKYRQTPEGKAARRAEYKKLQEKRKMEFKEYKSKLHCRRCGLSFEGQPEICDFHHTNDAMRSNIHKGKLSELHYRNGTYIRNNELSVTIPLCHSCHRQVHVDAP